MTLLKDCDVRNTEHNITIPTTQANFNRTFRRLAISSSTKRTVKCEVLVSYIGYIISTYAITYHSPKNCDTCMCSFIVTCVGGS